MGRLRPAKTLLLVLFLLAPSARAASPPTLEIEAVCLPQLAGCVPPDDACAGVAPPGGHVALRVRALRDGAPLAYARLDADGKTAWTSSDGRARVAFADGALLRVALGDAVAAHPLRRVALAAHLVDPPAVADALDPPTLRVRVVDAATGEPVEGARVLARVGAASLDLGPSGLDGVASARLSSSGEPEETVSVLDASFCGLPVAELPPPFDLSWRIPEREAPPTLVLHPPSGWARGPAFELPYTAHGPRPPHTLEWRLDGGAWQPEPLALPEGVHVVEARVHDAAGRTSDVARAKVRVDASPPTLRIPKAWASCAPLDAGATDARSGVAWTRLFVDGAERSPGDLTLAEREHDLRVEAMDAAGNHAVAASRISCDSTPPEVAPRFDLSAWSRCDAASWVVGDARSGVVGASATVDGHPTPVSVGGGALRAALPEGVSTAVLRVTDAAGNARESAVTTRCDRSPPSLVLAAAAPAGAVAEASDPHSGVRDVRLRVDDGPWLPGPSVALEGEGPRLVRAEATDAAGNLATATLHLSIDTVAPRLQSPRRAEPGAAFEVEVADADLATVEAGDGSAWAALAPSAPGRYVVTPAAPGALLLRARDAAGNVAVAQVEVAAPAPARAPIAPAPVAQPPPALPDEPRAAPVKLESLVVSVLEGRDASEVRLTGVVDGIRDGEAFLVAPDGRRASLGAVRLDDGSLRLEASSVLEGTYVLELRLRTEGGATLVHEAGNVTLARATGGVLEAAATEKPTPGIGVGLLAVLALVAVGRRRR